MAEYKVELSAADVTEAGFSYNEMMLGGGPTPWVPEGFLIGPAEKWETTRFGVAGAALMMGVANNLLLVQANAASRADAPIPSMFSFGPAVGVATSPPPPGITGNARVAWLANNRAIRMLFREARSVYHSGGLPTPPIAPPSGEPEFAIAQALTVGAGIAIGLIGAAAVGGVAWWGVEAKRATVELEKHTRQLAAHAAAYSKYLTQMQAQGLTPEPPDAIVEALAKQEESSGLVMAGAAALVGAAVGAGGVFAAMTKKPRRANPTKKKATKKKATKKNPAKKKATKKRATAKKKATKKNPAKKKATKRQTKAQFLASQRRKGRTAAQAEADWKLKRTRRNPKKKSAVKKKAAAKKRNPKKAAAKKRSTKKRASKKKATVKKNPRLTKQQFLNRQRRKGRTDAQAKADWRLRQRRKKR